jgi:YVTN family beta-propeller protein
LSIAFPFDGKYAFVVAHNTDKLIVLDAERRSVLKSLGVGSKPVAVEVSPDSRTVYVVNQNSNDVSVVDIQDPAAPLLLARIPVGKHPEGAALLPDGSKLYVSNSVSNSVSVFQVVARAPYLSLVKTIAVGKKPSGIAATRLDSFIDGDYVYVSNRVDGTVSVIDTINDSVVVTVPVGKGPRGVAVGIVRTR